MNPRHESARKQAGKNWAQRSGSSNNINFTILEMNYKEVPWRGPILLPAEEFQEGYFHVNDRSGLGFGLDHAEVAKHLLPGTLYNINDLRILNTMVDFSA